MAEDAPKDCLPNKRYPLGYDAGMRAPWIPVPEDLVRFLFGTCTKNQIAVIFALLQARDFNGGSETVCLTDRKLKERTDMNWQTLGRTLKERRFTALVRIQRGTPRAKGQPGVPTSYDLTPLWKELRTWREPKAVAEEPATKSWREEMEELATRARARIFGPASASLGGRNDEVPITSSKVLRVDVPRAS